MKKYNELNFEVNELPERVNGYTHAIRVFDEKGATVFETGAYSSMLNMSPAECKTLAWQLENSGLDIDVSNCVLKSTMETKDSMFVKTYGIDNGVMILSETNANNETIVEKSTTDKNGLTITETNANYGYRDFDILTGKGEILNMVHVEGAIKNGNFSAKDYSYKEYDNLNAVNYSLHLRRGNPMVEISSNGKISHFKLDDETRVEILNKISIAKEYDDFSKIRDEIEKAVIDKAEATEQEIKDANFDELLAEITDNQYGDDNDRAE